ncbi:DUF4276 family protein [Flavobacterium sp. Sd200]|uniref:DUF4276 family protein n=1 Tax=Flavobacterium sp. Sd200 TaxID=2692211 RepID=UPI00136EB5CB|nr:DUF4276 family protein [Flavobacterium sp. Sd200]MXN91311.1 DUF4276 family protein [Flavobacterium sp. Sd200]
MRDLYFIVEGETELEFVNKVLIPYLYSQGLQCHIQGYPITMSGGGHGFNNIQHFINTITPVLNYKSEPVVTTLIDYFRLNSETKLPGYGGCHRLNATDDKVAYLENCLNQVVQSVKEYRFFIPYIQKHEMETLLFANPEEGFAFESDAILNRVLEVYNQYANIEDINGTEYGAPSKRLQDIYKADGKRYEKIVDGIEIAELTTINMMLEKCPRFRKWVATLLNVVTNS